MDRSKLLRAGPRLGMMLELEGNMIPRSGCQYVLRVMLALVESRLECTTAGRTKDPLVLLPIDTDVWLRNMLEGHITTLIPNIKTLAAEATTIVLSGRSRTLLTSGAKEIHMADPLKHLTFSTDTH